MEHREASLLLAELRDGQLTEEVAAAVARHADGCEECRGWVEAYALLRRAVEADDESLPAHPPGDHIARFAVAPETMDDVQCAAVATHVRTCESCRRELETTRLAVADSAGTARQGWWRPSDPTFRVALAASLLVALLAYPAHRGLRTVMGPTTEYSGPVGYLLLTGEPRGETPIETMTIRPGQPYLLIAVAMTLPEGIAPDDRLVVRTLQDGRIVWETPLTAAEIAAELAQFEVLFLQLPSSWFPAGDYELQLSATKTDEILFSSRFRLQPGDER
jgi:hypothetical protein